MSWWIGGAEEWKWRRRVKALGSNAHQWGCLVKVSAVGVVLTILVMTLVPVSSSGSISPLDKYENRCCWMLLIQQLFLSVYCMLLLLFTFASESTFMEIYKWQYKQSHMQHDYACTQSNKDIYVYAHTRTYTNTFIINLFILHRKDKVRN